MLVGAGGGGKALEPRHAWKLSQQGLLVDGAWEEARERDTSQVCGPSSRGERCCMATGTRLGERMEHWGWVGATDRGREKGSGVEDASRLQAHSVMVVLAAKSREGERLPEVTESQRRGLSRGLSGALTLQGQRVL